jgi:DNA-binding response OmpR family regulator
VAIAHSGEEALALARRLKPDVITLDIRLPDIDGLKLADIFRHDPDTKHARVMVISGYHEREAAMRAGASGFLLKPINPDTLLASVDALMAATTRRKGKVLVIDDDAQIRAICVEVMHNLGFEVTQAATLAEARAEISARRPDLLLLDVMLPDGDGFSFFEELKAERASSQLSVIFVSARTETSAKVRALKLGGDDYLTKPFDALELGARVESVLRRRTEEGSPSPTTMLPGTGAIEREVQRRLAAREAFAFCYLDLDNLKAYNDYYGFAKADGVVRQTADLMREIMMVHGGPGDFLGHVAGDDFVFITVPQTVDLICQKAIEAFDRIIPLYYDRTDRERGYIETDDRFGERRRFPIMSVSVVAVMAEGNLDHSSLAKLAAEMKKRAKAVLGSVYLRSDRAPAPLKPDVKLA